MAKNFREIFGELAPQGQGQLVMQKRTAPDPQEEADPEEDEEAGPSDRPDAMERYAGVKVKVMALTMQVQPGAVMLAAANVRLKVVCSSASFHSCLPNVSTHSPNPECLWCTVLTI